MEKNLNVPSFWNEEDLLLNKAFQKELFAVGMCMPSVNHVHAQLIEPARPLVFCYDDINSLKAFMPSRDEAYAEIMGTKTILDLHHNVKKKFIDSADFYCGKQAEINFESLDFHVPFFKEEAHEFIFNQSFKDFNIDREESFFKFEPRILKTIEERHFKEKLKGKKAPGGRSNKQHLNILNLNKKRRP